MSNPTRMGLIVFPFFAFACIWWAARRGLGMRMMESAQELRLWSGTMFSWAFIGTAVLAVLCVIIASGALGSVRVGGPDAKPRLTYGEMIAVGFAASTSIGLLFWASVEPLMHSYRPPPVSGILPRSPEAFVMARSSAYLHWGLIAHMIYALFMIGFAVTVETMRLRPSVASALSGHRSGPYGFSGGLLDGTVIAFVTLILIAGLASCVLGLSDHMTQLSGAIVGRGMATAILVLLVLFALVSAARPMGRTYALLAVATLALLGLFLLVILIFAPKREVIGGGLKAFWWMFKYAPQLSMNGFIGEAGDWAGRWTVTYIGVWMALGPIIGYFLSRAARGYRLSEAIGCLVIMPMLLSMLSILVIGGLTLSVDRLSNGAVLAAVQERGVNSAVFVALSTLGAGPVLKALFIALVALFFMTFSAAILHGVLHIAVPGADADRRVIMERRAALFVWCIALGTSGWFAARDNIIPLIEVIGRLGALPGVLITFMMVFAVLRLCMLPASRLKPPPDPNAAPKQDNLRLERVDTAKPAGVVYEPERRKSS